MDWGQNERNGFWETQETEVSKLAYYTEYRLFQTSMI